MFQLLRALKLHSTLLILIFLNLTLIPEKLSAQKNEIQINLNEPTLSQFINEIESQTSYRFIYNSRKVDNATIIKANIKAVSVRDALAQASAHLSYSFNVQQDQIIILSQDEQTSGTIESRLIRGKVTDATGLGLPGATITIKNTKQGVMTDAEGNFSTNLNAVNISNTQLEVKFLGMEPQTLIVGNQSVFNIKMQEAQNELEQVIITSSYGTKKLKEEVVGSIVTITDKDIPTQQASESVDKMLEGQLAGVIVENTTGVGGPVKINIRGQGSLSPLNNTVLGTSTQPLIIVDGVIMTEQTGIDNSFFDGSGNLVETFNNPLSQISPDDIESINVLKDAAAVGVYGADGANGVILITTKKGRKGSTRFNFSSQLGISEAINQIKYLNGSQYTQVRNEYLKNTSGTTVPQNEVNTDWFDLLNSTGVYKKYNFSASGATQKFNYRASVTYLDIDEPQVGNGARQINTNFNVGYKAEKLSLNLSLSPSYIQNTQPNIYFNYAFPPNLSPYDENGDYALLGLNGFPNPLAAANQNLNETNTYGVLGSFNVEYKLLPELKVSSLFGIDYKDKEQDRYFSAVNESGRLNGSFILDGIEYPRWGRRLINERNSTRWNWQTQAFFEKRLGEHSVDLLAGIELSEEKTDFAYASGAGFVNPEILNPVSAALQDDDPATEANERFNNQTYAIDINNNSRVSAYSQFNYNYAGKYFLLANFRRDESSVFGTDSNVAYNGGLGISWILSKENFLSDSNWLDFLKLKASYGTTGNSRIGSYRALGLYTRGINNGYNGLNEAFPSAAPNPNLSWEKNNKFNAGVEINVFKKLQLSVEYYYDDLKDLITSRDIPTENGFGNLQLNAAEMYNKGFEFSATMNWIESKAFKWKTSFNLATLENKVTNLIGLGSDYSTAANALAQKIGYSTSAIWGINWVGIDPATGRDLVSNNGEIYDLATYRQLYDQDAWEVIGNNQPDYYGGFSNTFHFGFGLSLNVRGSYQVGGEELVDYQLISQYNFINSRNLSVNAIDYWKGPGDAEAQLPVVSNTNPIAPNLSRYLYDATFIKISNINLSYRVPINPQNVFLDDLNVFVDISNAAYWYRDKSPEGRNGLREFKFIYPQARTISLGLKTSF